MALNASILNQQVLSITLFKPIFGACMVLCYSTHFVSPTNKTLSYFDKIFINYSFHPSLGFEPKTLEKPLIIPIINVHSNINYNIKIFSPSFVEHKSKLMQNCTRSHNCSNNVLDKTQQGCLTSCMKIFKHVLVHLK